MVRVRVRIRVIRVRVRVRVRIRVRVIRVRVRVRIRVRVGVRVKVRVRVRVRARVRVGVRVDLDAQRAQRRVATPRAQQQGAAPLARADLGEGQDAGGDGGVARERGDARDGRRVGSQVDGLPRAHAGGVGRGSDALQQGVGHGARLDTRAAEAAC